ncbi:hypothetical protein ACVWYN_000480 [Pedobacter sp. UYP24]
MTKQELLAQPYHRFFKLMKMFSKLSLSFRFAIYLLLVSLSCHAQKLYPYKTIDRHCKDCDEFTYTGGMLGFHLKPIIESKNEIEIRLYTASEHGSR